MKNKIIVVTGGAGFVGTNLINYLLFKTRNNIISLDDYSSGSKKNHINNKRVKYLKGHTKDISKILNSNKKILIQYFTLVNFREFTKAFFR